MSYDASKLAPKVGIAGEYGERVCWSSAGLILLIQYVFDTVNCAGASNRGIHLIERVWARYIRSIGFKTTKLVILQREAPYSFLFSYYTISRNLIKCK